MSAALPKVLIVTYYFPPAGGAGVQRILKFVKYLRDFGWEPVVLTARNADYPVQDDSLSAEIPAGVKVYRSRIFEPYRAYRNFTGKSKDESIDISTLTLDLQQKRRLSERISEWIRSVFFVPDARIAWLPFAYRQGIKIIREEKIDVIFSSAPPYTTHLIGLKLKRRSGLPWVVDFRDSWIGWVSAPKWRPKLSRAIERSMEFSVLSESTRILTVSRGVKDDLLSRHTGLSDRRWIKLPNGYDAEDFRDLKPIQEKTTFIITYVGSLYGPRSPEYLLQALEALKAAGSTILDQVRVRIVGRVDHAIARRIRSSTVVDMFEMIPYVPHRESLRYLLASDILLLIIDDTPTNRGILTGKLFEYIGAGRPILALAPDGEATELIDEYHLGWTCSPRDVTNIKETLLHILTEETSCDGRDSADSPVRRQFERRQQAGVLAGVLDTAAGFKQEAPA